MTHASALGLLEAYLDRELDVSEQAAVQEHLESCPACVEAYSRLHAIGKGWPQVLGQLLPRHEFARRLQ